MDKCTCRLCLNTVKNPADIVSSKGYMNPTCTQCIKIQSKKHNITYVDYIYDYLYGMKPECAVEYAVDAINKMMDENLLEKEGYVVTTSKDLVSQYLLKNYSYTEDQVNEYIDKYYKPNYIFLLKRR